MAEQGITYRAAMEILETPQPVMEHFTTIRSIAAKRTELKAGLRHEQ